MQGPIERSENPINPYPEGSARWKLWNRREKDRLAKEKPKPKPKPKTPEDKSKRRKKIDDYLDSTE